MPKQIIIAIAADEARNAGERDYYFAMMDQLEGSGATIITAKIGVEPHLYAQAEEFLRPARDNAAYAALPGFCSSHMAQIAASLGPDSDIHVLALGQSTLRAASELIAVLRLSCQQAQLSWVTHMVQTGEELHAANNADATIFAPIGREALAALDEAEARDAKLVHIDAMPHTNSVASCAIHADAFARTENGKALQRWMDNQEDFALVVLNAGFGVTGADGTSRHVPYTEAEATAHGAALAARLQPGTNILLMHGGPRNHADTAAGHNTVPAFLTGLGLGGQMGEVAFEPFAQGLPYNVIKAAYIAARSPYCKAFISNAEGYGTMDAAALHVDRHRTLLGMFPFDALKTSPQRMDNIDLYNQRGIAVLEPFGHPGATVMPPANDSLLATRDPSEAIASHLGILPGRTADLAAAPGARL